MRRRIFLLLLIGVFLLPATASAAQNWNSVVDRIDNILRQAVATYGQGDVAKAKELVNEAYFGPFESDRMEQAVRTNISAKRAAELEFQFNSIRKMMTSGADLAQVQEEADALVLMLRKDAETLRSKESGSVGRWFYSFLILVREGVEAILIIAAITAYLIKSGNGNRVKEVFRSALAAVLASIVTAYLFHAIFKISGAAQEVLEGGVLILATIVLLPMSFWMFGQADPRRWKRFVEGKVRASLSGGGRMALAFAVFLAVYREGAETVLFYQAMFADSSESNSAIWLGIVTGAAVLVVLFYLIRYGSVRLPLKPFFLISAALLYVLAFVFAGEGIKELQASGIVGYNEISGLFTVGALGIYPSWEGIAAQSVLALIPLAALVKVLPKKLSKGA